MGLRNWWRAVTNTKRKLDTIDRTTRELLHEMKSIRIEWEEAQAEMFSMYDKLQAWAARQAKRDKAIAGRTIEQLAGPDNEKPGQIPLEGMTKAELRRYSQESKPHIKGVR